jgi:hypothetical protein
LLQQVFRAPLCPWYARRLKINPVTKNFANLTCAFAKGDFVPRTAFQVGHADSIPVTRSTVLDVVVDSYARRSHPRLSARNQFFPAFRAH